MMTLQLLTISLLSIGLVSCSINPDMVQPETQLIENQKTQLTKKPNRRHKTLAEGVISVDIARYNHRLHLLTGKHNAGKKSLSYQYSEDSGISWSPETKILNSDNIAAKMTRGNDAQITAQAENIIITWTKFDYTAPFNAGPMIAVRSTDKGQSWQHITTPPDWKKGPHGYIDLAADKQALHAVWLDSRISHSDIEARQGLRYARSIDGGLSWQKNITLDNKTCSCCWNTINTDTNGNAYVLYRDKQPSDLSITVINPQQQSKYISHVGAFNWQFDGCPHIGGGFDFQDTNGKNRIHAVVGTGHPKHLGIHYLYSDDAGENWSAAYRLGNESAIHADIASHNNGRVIAVWDMMTANGLAIFFAESLNQGQSWSKPKQISAADMRATHPNIIKTKNGFLAVWTESDGQHQTLAKKYFK